MAYVDEATIQAIRKKHPIKDIIERYHIGLIKKGEDYWGNCPFHMSVLGKEDRNASMSISSRLDIFQCFSCKTAGNIFNFVALMENISYGEAIHLLAREDGFEVGNVVKRENPHMKDFEVMNLAIKFYQNNMNRKSYLQNSTEVGATPEQHSIKIGDKVYKTTEKVDTNKGI